MSIKSWKAEFYPVSARDAAKLGMVAACEHSLRKWTGFLPENLEKHQVAFDVLCYDRNFSNVGSCALCQLFYDDDVCCNCPLTRTKANCLGLNSPYTQVTQKEAGAEVLVAALKKALKWAKKHEGKAEK